MKYKLVPVDQNDRELLELAAKAAGLPVKFSDEFVESTEVNGWWPCGYDESGDVVSWWNPLEHDGDALRLAVDLEIVIGCKPAPYAELPSRLRLFGVGEDQASRMRMAIVRAAAEIGKLKHSGEYCKRGVTHEQ